MNFEYDRPKMNERSVILQGILVGHLKLAMLKKTALEILTISYEKYIHWNVKP